MVELKNYQIDIAEPFALYRNNPIIFDSGYDKERDKNKAAFKNGKIIDDYLWVKLNTP